MQFPHGSKRSRTYNPLWKRWRGLSTPQLGRRFGGSSRVLRCRASGVAVRCGAELSRCQDECAAVFGSRTGSAMRSDAAVAPKGPCEERFSASSSFTILVSDPLRNSMLELLTVGRAPRSRARISATPVPARSAIVVNVSPRCCKRAAACPPWARSSSRLRSASALTCARRCARRSASQVVDFANFA